jgi:transcriptional regulator with XRE-family HTH domain
VLVLYNSSNVAENIKKWSKDKGIPVGQLLADCGLNKNTLSTMTARGSWISVESLAKIADRLDVSLDLIVGRQKAVLASTTTKQSELLMIFNQL